MSSHAVFRQGANVRGGKCPAPTWTKLYHTHTSCFILLPETNPRQCGEMKMIIEPRHKKTCLFVVFFLWGAYAKTTAQQTEPLFSLHIK